MRTLPAARRLTGRAVAAEIARRLADPSVLGEAIAASRRDSTLPVSVQWRDHSLAAGYAGTAVLFAALDAAEPDNGWDRSGHAHLSQAVAAAGRRGSDDPSLFTGLAGIGYAAVCLTAGRNRYRRLLDGVDAALLPRVAERVDRLQTARGCSVGAFDLISGLTGTAVYLLARRDHEPACATLHAVLAGLTRLLADDGDPPAWHTPAGQLVGSMAQAYPAGNLNCGLAHGVPGPLALLAVAAAEGVIVPGMDAAIERAADWLANHRTETAWGPEWPTAIGLGSQPDTSAATPPGPARTAWCYGSPGVARALWLAGTALGDEGCRMLAVRTIHAVLDRTPTQRGLTSPTFCHGRAGLQAIVSGFARDTGSPTLATSARALTGELLDAYDPEAVLGYRNVETGGVRTDQPGLLDGATGVALTLLASDNPSPVLDRLFLLG